MDYIFQKVVISLQNILDFSIYFYAFRYIIWLIFENSQIVQLSELVYQQIIHPGMDLLGVYPPSPGQRGAGGVLFFMIKQKNY
jgi:hypothetical protein